MENNVELKKIIKCLRLFQTIDPEMQIPTILTFLERIVWDKDEVPIVKELGKIAFKGASIASASRNVMFWCESNRHREKGVNMMETKEHPMDRRSKQVFMKQKGIIFADTLRNIISE